MWVIHHDEGVTLFYLRGETVPYSGYHQPPVETMVTQLRSWSSNPARLSALRQILTEIRVVPAAQIGRDAATVVQQFEGALRASSLYATSKARPRIIPGPVLQAPRRMAPWDLDPPSDARVTEIMNDALRRGANTDGITHIDNAWMIVQSWREAFRLLGWADGATANLNYAAADHYFQNRYYSMGGTIMPGPVMAVAMTAVILAYDFAKATVGVYRSGSGAPSPPSSFVRGWSYRGTADGVVTRAVSAVMRLAE